MKFKEAKACAAFLRPPGPQTYHPCKPLRRPSAVVFSTAGETVATACSSKVGPQTYSPQKPARRTRSARFPTAKEKRNFERNAPGPQTYNPQKPKNHRSPAAHFSRIGQPGKVLVERTPGPGSYCPNRPLKRRPSCGFGTAGLSPTFGGHAPRNTPRKFLKKNSRSIKPSTRLIKKPRPQPLIQQQHERHQTFLSFERKFAIKDNNSTSQPKVACSPSNSISKKLPTKPALIVLFDRDCRWHDSEPVVQKPPAVMTEQPLLAVVLEEEGEKYEKALELKTHFMF